MALDEGLHFRRLVLHWAIQLVLCWQLILRVESLGEVDPTNPAVGMDLRERAGFVN